MLFRSLTVRCELDANTYIKGVKVSDAEMAALNMKADAFTRMELHHLATPMRSIKMNQLFRGVA